ncbi:Uncharacterised protein [Bordetella pertussis]|nr:Uncharacterised protein [Bordetella pertussis]
MPFGFLAALAAGLVLPLRGRGDRHVADGRPIRAVTHFRVATQIADENDFVDGCHADAPLLPARAAAWNVAAPAAHTKLCLRPAS